MDSQFICEHCLMNYSSEQKCCPFCDWPSPFSVKNKTVSNINCPKCGFQNDLTNAACVSCDASIYEKQNKQQGKVKCQHCGLMIMKKIINQHLTDCFLSMQMIKEHQKQQAALKQQQDYNKTIIQCKYCHISVPQDLLNQHNEVCTSKPKPVVKPLPGVVKPYGKPYILPKPVPFSGSGVVKNPQKPVIQPYEQIYVPTDINQHDLFSDDQLKRLTKIQKNAILYMQSKSMKAHKDAQKQVHQKAKRLGFNKQDIQNLLFYIENHAPIIIHIHITKHMQFFIKDTHYRNQFETGKSSGSLSRQSRIQWQNRMFDKKYASATDHQRVKYGVVNFTNDPKGVNCASGYGISYFLLKQHVRNRCTVTDMDSSSVSSIFGTFKYCFHVLNKMNDAELKSAFNAAKALQQSSSVTTTYKQIQIHGPVQFAKDIQRIYVNKKQVKDKKFLDMVYSFCEKNKVDYEFI